MVEDVFPSNSNYFSVSFTNLVLFIYCSKNLLLLQVGFKSLSYDVQKQTPAYDLNALLGKCCNTAPNRFGNKVKTRGYSSVFHKL